MKFPSVTNIPLYITQSHQINILKEISFTLFVKADKSKNFKKKPTMELVSDDNFSLRLPQHCEFHRQNYL